jgi:hypothetical protein
MYGCILLAADHRISYGVLMTPTSRLSAWNLLIDPLSGAQRGAYIQRMAVFDPGENLPHTQPFGLYLQFAQQDIFVSQADAQIVYVAALSPKELHAHAATHALALTQATQDRLTWLKQRLQLVG